MANIRKNYSISPERLKAIAKISGLGCRRLGRLIGVSHVCVYYWMTGKRGISTHNIKKLLKVFPELRGAVDE